MLGGKVERGKISGGDGTAEFGRAYVKRHPMAVN